MRILGSPLASHFLTFPAKIMVGSGKEKKGFWYGPRHSGRSLCLSDMLLGHVWKRCLTRQAQALGLARRIQPAPPCSATVPFFLSRWVQAGCHMLTFDALHTGPSFFFPRASTNTPPKASRGGRHYRAFFWGAVGRAPSLLQFFFL